MNTHTGYGINVRLALKDIYGIEDLTKDTVGRLEAAYHAAIKPGFYRHLLRDVGNIESCQVNVAAWSRNSWTASERSSRPRESRDRTPIRSGSSSVRKSLVDSG